MKTQLIKTSRSKRAIVYFLLFSGFLIILTGCSTLKSNPLQPTKDMKITQKVTELPTKTDTATPEPTLTETPTQTLTPTATIAPTPLGGISPKIAFYGQSQDGKTYIYTGEIFSNDLTALMEINPTVENIHWYQVKWSRDGKLLAYTARDSKKGSGLFIYDIRKNESKLFLKLSSRQYAYNFIWSPDNSEISFDLESSGVMSIRRIILKTSTVKSPQERIPEHWGMGPSGNKYVDTLTCNGREISNYPDLETSIVNYHCSDEDNEEDRIAFLAADGAETTIATFEEVSWNGDLILNVSPDKKSAILTCLYSGFFFPIQFSNIPYHLKQEDLIKYAYHYDLDEWRKELSPGRYLLNLPEQIRTLKDQNYSIMMDWSPDSRFYVFENSPFYVTDIKSERYPNFKSKWHFSINEIDTLNNVYEYYIPEAINPLVYAGQGFSGFDVVWPK